MGMKINSYLCSAQKILLIGFGCERLMVMWVEHEKNYLPKQQLPQNMCMTMPGALVTLKGPIMTAADDKFCDIFPNFRKKSIIFDENRQQTILMKSYALFVIFF